MFRTIKVGLIGDIQPLIATAVAYRQACQIALEYGFKNKTFNKNKVHIGVYHRTRQRLPTLQSSLVQTARDQACEMLKLVKLRKKPKRARLQVRYNARTFTFFPKKKMISLATVNGRKKYQVHIPEYFRQHYKLDTYTNAELVVRNGRAYLNIQCEIEGYTVDNNNEILGIDRGILNIVTCEDNTFVNAKHLRAVKARYHHLKAKLQSLGTRSAKRKLQRLSGRERRFVLDTNHCISRALVNKPYGIYVLEQLHISRQKKKGRRFNGLLGNWSPSQLLSLLWYKAESAGKLVLLVNPRHTSQKCSKCGHVNRMNRDASRFHCLQCGFQLNADLNADLNAARNIGQLGRSLLVRLQTSVNEPIVAQNGMAATSPAV